MNQERIWEKLEDESPEQFHAFTEFLRMTPRSERNCAGMIKKSKSTVYRWAARYNWRERAAAYDNSLLEDTRAAIKQQVPELLLKQWKDAAEIQSMAAAEIRRRGLERASFKSLNEIYSTAALQLQRTAEQLRIFEDDSKGDAVREIRIVRASPADVPKGLEL